MFALAVLCASIVACTRSIEIAKFIFEDKVQLQFAEHGKVAPTKNDNKVQRNQSDISFFMQVRVWKMKNEWIAHLAGGGRTSVFLSLSVSGFMF